MAGTYTTRVPPYADAANPDCPNCKGAGAAFYELATLPPGVRKTLKRYAPLKHLHGEDYVWIACGHCAHQLQAHGAPSTKPQWHT